MSKLFDQMLSAGGTPVSVEEPNSENPSVPEPQNHVVTAHAQEKAAIPQALKRGRLRPTLFYDHKTRIAPSRAISHATPFSKFNYEEDEHTSAEEYVAALANKIGSESEAASLQRAERQEEYDQSADALELKLPVCAVLDRAPKCCSRCGRVLPPDQPRTTILIVNQPILGEIGTIKAIAVHCKECGPGGFQGEAGSPVKTDDSWAENLRADALEAYKLHEKGLNQSEIGARMTRPRSQSSVSRLLREAKNERARFRQEKLRRTGGA
jgi:hypothetical protein